MRLKVTKDSISKEAIDQVHQGEYNVNTLEFEFSSDYDSVSKMAVFSNNFETYNVPITLNRCIIPSEILAKKCALTIGVYGYIVNNDVVEKRLSPKPITIELESGSYKEGQNAQEESPTQFEQYVEQMEQSFDDIQNQIDSKQGELTAGENVTITDDVISSYAPTKTSELENDSGYITNDVNNLVYYETKTNTGTTLVLSLDSSTYIMTLQLKNSAGATISTQSIDLPIETMIVNASYDNTTKELVLVLQSGNTIRVNIADLVSGLQTEITSQNKLSSDLVDDTNKTNKFVTATDITSWNAKYEKPSTRNTIDGLIK